MEPRTRTIAWLDTGGGPFVLMPDEVSRSWGGITSRQKPSHYDIAAGVTNYLEVIDVAGNDALVLGDAPYRTAWLPQPAQGGGYIVRVLWASDEDDVQRAIADVGVDGWSDEGVAIDVGSGKMVMFDAADRIGQALVRLRFELAPGRYVLATQDLQPSEATCLMIHRLLPIA